MNTIHKGDPMSLPMPRPIHFKASADQRFSIDGTDWKGIRWENDKGQKTVDADERVITIKHERFEGDNIELARVLREMADDIESSTPRSA